MVMLRVTFPKGVALVLMTIIFMLSTLLTNLTRMPLCLSQCTLRRTRFSYNRASISGNCCSSTIRLCSSSNIITDFLTSTTDSMACFSAFASRYLMASSRTELLSILDLT
ncbi:BadF/BadG/BcrA/BcrD ATPase family protein [Striga asiatica]|uniref:BadF/BadG/BcrA/BcrD ATPase family protein n=1 Tax=Striga asiatica TaxID=4170 RepID=A0A5A7PDL3_STRAF|nr:BadF/BadG/BcrA/BcrD ATPase family protein [Striga asiatica]